jgi:acetyl-CoA carboxylase carboxyl transferase subunit alpha
MSKYILDFEKSIRSIEDKIISIENSTNKNDLANNTLISLRSQLDREIVNTYSNLSRWQKVQLARHPNRPHAIDYIKHIVQDWLELHGDRKFSDDKSIITGFGYINNIKCAIIAQEKGKNTKDRLFRNFGMPKPEGYRKALRIMKLAEKFHLPVITLIDTPGAYPGIGAEERGQSQAIADNLLNMSLLKVPIISLVIGEGASGGALAIGLSDRILCLENSWYSVISPEGCASILFGDTSKNKEAAESLKLTSEDLYELNIADIIIDEPVGGIHHNPSEVYIKVVDILCKEINYLTKLSVKDLINQRMNKYDNIGKFLNE